MCLQEKNFLRPEQVLKSIQKRLLFLFVVCDYSCRRETVNIEFLDLRNPHSSQELSFFRRSANHVLDGFGVGGA